MEWLTLDPSSLPAAVVWLVAVVIAVERLSRSVIRWAEARVERDREREASSADAARMWRELFEAQQAGGCPLAHEQCWRHSPMKPPTTTQE